MRRLVRPLLVGLCVSLSQSTVIRGSVENAVAPLDPDELGERLSKLESEAGRSRHDDSIRRGAQVYARQCAACHGRTGRGDGPGAADLRPAPRDFTSGQFRFRSTPNGTPPRPEDLVRTIRRGLPGTAMPAFDDLLSSGEIADLMVFIDSLLPAAWREENPPEPIPLPSIPPATGTMLSEGRGLYLTLECWTCHGLKGDGRGPSGAGLRDETGRPSRPADFRFDPFKAGRRPATLVLTLATGLSGTPMPAYGEAMLFTREDIQDSSTTAGRLPPEVLEELTQFARTTLTRAEIDALSGASRGRLRDHRLASLAHYVLSLDRRHGLGFWLLRQQPENEPRLP